jgi:hypothetical protein
MAEEKGTGKHPHKSTEEPQPHHEAPTTKGSESKSGSHRGGSHSGSQDASGKSDESSDLKSREYTDKEGNVHHHTKTYEEQHKGKK